MSRPTSRSPPRREKRKRLRSPVITKMSKASFYKELASGSLRPEDAQNVQFTTSEGSESDSDLYSSEGSSLHSFQTPRKRSKSRSRERSLSPVSRPSPVASQGIVKAPANLNDESSVYVPLQRIEDSEAIDNAESLSWCERLELITNVLKLQRPVAEAKKTYTSSIGSLFGKEVKIPKLVDSLHRHSKTFSSS